jgi:glucose-1-phosphate adenylyltransferase
MKKKIIAMLLAGGVGSRLNILAQKRAKPAIPFGGIYRIIDFTMSNIANSGIEVVGVLTQYKPLSLMDHLEDGRPWDLFGRTRQTEILPPKTGEGISDWYKGTSDAVFQNYGFIEENASDQVLIASGDHIYNMDYRVLSDFHEARAADATVCLVRVPEEEARYFGIALTDSENRIVDWSEKPARPKSNLASMGVYLFNKKILGWALNRAQKKGGTDFAKDVIPMLLKKKNVFGFEFNGYWRDVGTLDAYWNANMDLLRIGSGLDIENWQIKTNMADRGEIGDRPSAYFSLTARAINSLISRGCIVEGTVENSILSPGVKVGKNALVRNSIVFHDTTIGDRANLNRTICDKDVMIGEQAQIGGGDAIPNQTYPGHLYTGLTIIGKTARVPPLCRVGTNTIIKPNVDLTLKKIRTVPPGSTV